MSSQFMSGTSQMDDRMVALDLLLFAKTGVKTYASALTEASTQEVRTVLKRQLNEAIDFQEQVTNFMVQKGWYNAYNTNEQIKMDLSQTQTTIHQLSQQGREHHPSNDRFIGGKISPKIHIILQKMNCAFLSKRYLPCRFCYVTVKNNSLEGYYGNTESKYRRYT